MTFDTYKALPGVNQSTLKEILVSPLQYQYRLKTPREDTARLALGRAVHTAILQPELMTDSVAVWHGGTRRGKEWDAYKAAHAGKVILTEDEAEQVTGMAAAVRGNALVKSLMARGAAEQVIQWERGGVQCKAMLDWIGDTILDFKSANDIEPHRFAATAARLGYHFQAAWYQSAVLATTGKTLPVYLVAFETDAPHDVLVYKYTDDALYLGEQEYSKAMALLKECTASGVWPGRSVEPLELDVPAWAWGDNGSDDVTATVVE